ncbi:MAG: hypothetical protein PUG48_09295 [Clostridia bacterium]|nr:hypothetical protein [Clostridia bacterium]
MLLFIIGLFIGCLIGVNVTALCTAFSKADKQSEKFKKIKNRRKK